MHWIDYVVFGFYFIAMMAVGVYFFFQNKGTEDYYVGGRDMSSTHVGLSVVATDVGGGFSIGLGGLGFSMGLSGSWMLFTGLVGAWLSAVLLIPKVVDLAKEKGWLTFPQLFEYFYNKKVALVAAAISVVGYIGFTSSQILAGAKLASAKFLQLDLKLALIIMGVIAVAYTAMGGIKAVIYTDTIQWTILMVGLIFVGLPMGYYSVGGYDTIKETLPSDFLTLTNISWVQMINWMVTIVPIWFVGMTLYQRIYACKDKKTAQKAWYIAGLFEYPIMAFMGVSLGLLAKVAFINGHFDHIGFLSTDTMDAEMGLPLLLRTVLPIGFTGLMLSAYFSAIMSTADSCLMAASGHIVTDIFGSYKSLKFKNREIAYSQLTTLVVGVVAIVIAMYLQNVLELMLISYAFMVSGLFVPLVVTLFFNKRSPSAAIFSMLSGGVTYIIMEFMDWRLPLGLDSNIGGIIVSAFMYFIIDKWESLNNLKT